MALKFFDKLKLSPFAPWHYLTYHKPFFFDSQYIFDELKFKPQGSNLEILIESYKSYLTDFKEDNQNIKSPHKSKLKASTIDLIANLISFK